jgi:hypothetical protein
MGASKKNRGRERFNEGYQQGRRDADQAVPMQSFDRSISWDFRRGYIEGYNDGRDQKSAETGDSAALGRRTKSPPPGT